MDSIAVTKPNMTVTGQEALSPFGLLSELFTEELARRRSLSTGFYRPMTLAYLEEPEGEGLSSPPEIHFDLNVDLLLDRLLKDAREKEKNEEKPKTPAERILERVVVRERELRTVYRDTRRMVIETGGRRFTASAPERTQALPPGSSDQSRTETVIIPSRQEMLREGEALKPVAAEKTAPASFAQPFSSVVSARPIASRLTGEVKASDRTLPLASQMLSVPAKGGWTPRERELHPGYPVRTETNKDGAPETGSILLPDVLRRRREEAIARSEIQRSAVDPQEYPDALGEALEWITEGTERTTETERIMREVRRAVEETLRRNAARDAAPGKQPAKHAGPDEQNAETYTGRRQSGDRESSLYARAHAYREQPEAQETARDKERMEAAPRREAGVSAPNERRAMESRDRYFVEAEEASEKSLPAQSAGERRAAQAEAYTQEAAGRFTEQIPVVPGMREAEASAPAELVFREGVDAAEPFKASEKIIKTAEQLKGETAEPYTPQGTAHTVPSNRPETAVRPGSGIIADIRTAEEAQPETVISAGIPAETEARSAAAELILRESPEEPSENKTARTSEAVTDRAAQPSAETAAKTVVPERAAYVTEPERRREARGITTQSAEAASGSEVPAGSEFAGSAPGIKPVYSQQAEARSEASAQTENAVPTPALAETAEKRPAQAEFGFQGNIAEPTPQSAAEAAKAEKSEQPKETAYIAVPEGEYAQQPDADELFYREETDEVFPESAEQAESLTKPQETPHAPAARADIGSQKDTEPRGSTYAEISVRPEAAVPTAVPAEDAALKPAPAETGYREVTEAASAQNPPYAKAQPTAHSDTQTETPSQLEETVPYAIPAEEAEKTLPAETVYREDSKKNVLQSAELSETAKQAQASAQVPTEVLHLAAAPKAETDIEPVREAAQNSPKPSEVNAQPESAIPSGIPAEEAYDKAGSAELAYRETEETTASPGLKEANKATYRETAEQAAVPAEISEQEPLSAELKYREDAEASAPQSTIDAERPEQQEAEVRTALPAEAEAQKPLPAELMYREYAEVPAPQSGTETEKPEEHIYREAPAEAVPPSAEGSAGTVRPETAVHTAVPAEGTEQRPAPAELTYRETAEANAPQSAESEEINAQPETAIPSAVPAREAAEQSAQPETFYRESAEGSVPQTMSYADIPTEAAAHTNTATDDQPKTAIPSDVFPEEAYEHPEAAELTYRDGAETVIPQSAEHAENPDRPREYARVSSEMPQKPGVQTQVSAPAPTENGRTYAAVKAVQYPEPANKAAPQSAALGETAEQPEKSARAEVPAEEYALKPAPAETVYRDVREGSASQTSPQANTPGHAPEQTKAPVPQTAAHTDAREGTQDQPEEAIPYAAPAEAVAFEPSPAETVYLENTENAVPVNAARSENPKHPAETAYAPKQIAAKAVGTEQEQARSAKEMSAKAAEPTAGSDIEPIDEAAGRVSMAAEIPELKEKPVNADLSQEEAAVSAAVPAEESAQRPAPTEIVYLENTENAAPESAAHTETAGQPQGSAHTSDEFLKNAAGSAQGNAPAQAEASKKTLLPAVEAHRILQTGTVRQDGANSETDHPETAIPSPIPAEEAIYQSEQEELTFREDAEETAPQDVMEAGYPAQPETAIQTAYPAEESAQESVPAELAFREDMTEATPQTAANGASKTQQGRSPGQRPGTVISAQGRERRAGQPQIAKPLPMTAGQTARDIRISAENGMKPKGAAHRGSSAAHSPRGAFPEQETAEEALPVMEEADAVMPQELVFAAPAQGVQPPADPTETRLKESPKADRTEALPQWAKELLEKSGVTETAVHSGVFGGKSASPNANQVNWTSPFKPAAQKNSQNGPADLSFKERAEEEKQTSSQFRISDAELQRTADRVYKIIEERLRRELRRSGR